MGEITENSERKLYEKKFMEKCHQKEDNLKQYGFHEK